MNKFVKETTIVPSFLGTYNTNSSKSKFLFFKEIILGVLFTLLSISLWAHEKTDSGLSETYFIHQIQKIKFSLVNTINTELTKENLYQPNGLTQSFGNPPANLIRTFHHTNTTSEFFSFDPDPNCNSGDWETGWTKFSCPNGFQVDEYDDGSMIMHGTIVNTANDCDQWDVYTRLHNKRTWTEWSALGRMFYEQSGGGNCSALHVDWAYYEIDETTSRWTGTPGYCNASKTVNVLHAPTDFSKAVQVGFGANNCGSAGCDCQSFNIRGWMDATGDLTLSCADFSLSIAGYDVSSDCSILNGGFEEDSNYWNSSYTTGVSITNDAYVGNKAIYLSGDKVSINQSWLPATPGFTYTASAWAKVTGTPDDALLSINFYDKDRNQIMNTAASAVSTTWSYLTSGSIAPANAFFVNINLYKNGVGSTATFDEICLEISPTIEKGSCASLNNSGFETTISTGWSVSGTVSQTTDKVLGSQAALIENAGNGGVNQQINVTGGNRYLLSAYLKQSGIDNWVGMGVTWLNASQEAISDVNISEFGSSYEKYNLSLKAPTNAAYASIWITKYGNGEVFIDEVCWQEFTVGARGCPGGLLLNPDFESGFTNWNGSASATTTTDAYSGTTAIVNTGNNNGIYQSINASPGTTYALEVFAKKTGSMVPSLGMKFFDSNSNLLSEKYSRINTTNYQLYHIADTAPPNATRLEVVGWNSSGLGGAYFDNFCLATFQLPTPSCSGCEISGREYDDYMWSLEPAGDFSQWKDYDIGQLALCDNGDGTLTIDGSILNGRDAEWDSSIGTSCGATDAWTVNLTLSDRLSWAEYQGNYEIHPSTPYAYRDLDYWAVTGTLTGLGCNAGREISILSASAGYRLQIGRGGSKHSTGWGVATWFSGEEYGHSVNADIYARIDSTCYTTIVGNRCPNKLSNPEFAGGKNDWQLSVDAAEGYAATWSIDNTNQLSGAEAAYIDITNSGIGTAWDIQLIQANKSIVAGQEYTLIFEAKADSPREILASVQLNSDPYDTYKSVRANLTTEGQTYSLKFTAPVSSNDIAVIFHLGKSSENVFIDNVTFSEACFPEICGNNIDDDGDSLIDSADPDCSESNCQSCLGPNLFNNASFENGTWTGTETFVSGVLATNAPQDWNGTSAVGNWNHGAAKWVETSKATHGNRALYINNPNSKEGVCLAQRYPIGPGLTLDTCSTYQVCFDWASFNQQFPNGNTTSSRPSIDFSFQDVNGNDVGFIAVKVGTLSPNQDWDNLQWTSISHTFSFKGNLTPPANTAYVWVNISEADPSGILLDNTSFCVLSTGCSSVEICDNGIDDDGDGLIDEEDSDCPIKIDLGANKTICPNESVIITTIVNEKNDACCQSCCERTVSNVGSCFGSTPFAFWTEHVQNGAQLYTHSYHATDQVKWVECADGTAWYSAVVVEHSKSDHSVSPTQALPIDKDTITITVQFSGYTTTPPSGSPKANACGTSTYSDWVYYTNAVGTMSSKLHGEFQMNRKGAAFQVGSGANVITPINTFGASGWFDVSGGDGYYNSTDINIELSSTCSNNINTWGTCESYKWSNGETGNSITVNPNTSTSYSVTVTDCDGSTATDSIFIIVNPSLCNEICDNGIDDDGDNLIDCADPDCGATTSLSVNSDSPDNCPLLNNGQISISATGSNLQYSINGGTNYQSSNIFTNLSKGNYTIRVRNTSTGCHTDYANNPLILSDAVCNEICDNGIDDDGDGLIDCADPDCENTNSIIVGVDPPQNCPQLTNGQITITASGDNLEYSIDNGSTYQSSNIFTNLTVGNYYIIVRNMLSDCTVNYHDNPIVIDDSSIPVANDYNLTLCPGFEFESNLSLNNLNKDNRAYSLLTAPNEGTVNIAKNGHFTYITNTPECGNDQFAYSICDTITNCCDDGIVYLNFKDTIKPTLENVPLDETYSCDEVIPSPPLIVAIDNCPQISLDIKETNTQGEDGCALHDYELTRTWTAYDICGNSTSASQVIDIQDVVAPDIFRIYTLPNGSRMVAGVMEFVNNNWKIINLPLNFDTQPIIFHQVISSNDATPVISQIRSVSTAQFELRISEEENNDNKHSREYVAWMAFEPSTQTNDCKLEAGHLDVSEAITNLNFKNAFAAEPALFLGSQTMSEDNPYTIQQDGLSTNSVAVNLQEEQSKDTETAHAVEKVGYLALDKTGDLREIKGSLIGEINTSTITANWTKINLEHTYANPVVIVSPLKKDGSNPATIRLKNVNSQFFEMRLETWEYLSGATPNQQVTYMVIEGSIPLESPSYCDYGTDSLVIGEDFIAIDNCDNNVSISYTETSEFIGTEKIIKRSWEAIDECNNATSYLQEISCQGVSLKLKSILQGAMLANRSEGLMRDDLRKKKLLPKEEPYSKMPTFKTVGSGGEQMDTTLLLVDGANGIVDWVFVELRNGQNKEEVVSTISALIQCDGDVVSANGDSLLHFLNIPIGNYFVSIRHRNHLGLLTLNPYVFSTNRVPFVDFTYNFTPVEGNNSSISIDNLQSMWSGDLDDDGRVIYQGPGNDIFYMFLHILKDEGNHEFLPNYISQGYTNNDFNLDGTVIFQGPNNDRANLLFNTILKHPENKNKFSNFIIVTDTRKGGN